MGETWTTPPRESACSQSERSLVFRYHDTAVNAKGEWSYDSFSNIM